MEALRGTSGFLGERTGSAFDHTSIDPTQRGDGRLIEDQPLHRSLIKETEGVDYNELTVG